MNADHYLSRFRSGRDVEVGWHSSDGKMVSVDEVMEEARRRDADPKISRDTHEQGMMRLQQGGRLQDAGEVMGVSRERARQIFWRIARSAYYRKSESTR